MKRLVLTPWGTFTSYSLLERAERWAEHARRAASFETARAAFEAVWRDYLPKCSAANFEEWRDQEAWTAEGWLETRV